MRIVDAVNVVDQKTAASTDLLIISEHQGNVRIECRELKTDTVQFAYELEFKELIDGRILFSLGELFFVLVSDSYCLALDYHGDICIEPIRVKGVQAVTVINFCQLTNFTNSQESASELRTKHAPSGESSVSSCIKRRHIDNLSQSFSVSQSSEESFDVLDQTVTPLSDSDTLISPTDNRPTDAFKISELPELNRTRVDVSYENIRTSGHELPNLFIADSSCSDQSDSTGKDNAKVESQTKRKVKQYLYISKQALLIKRKETKTLLILHPNSGVCSTVNFEDSEQLNRNLNIDFDAPVFVFDTFFMSSIWRYERRQKSLLNRMTAMVNRPAIFGSVEYTRLANSFCVPNTKSAQMREVIEYAVKAFECDANALQKTNSKFCESRWVFRTVNSNVAIACSLDEAVPYFPDPTIGTIVTSNISLALADYLDSNELCETKRASFILPFLVRCGGAISSCLSVPYVQVLVVDSMILWYDFSQLRLLDYSCSGVSANLFACYFHRKFYDLMYLQGSNVLSNGKITFGLPFVSDDLRVINDCVIQVSEPQLAINVSQLNYCDFLS